MKNSFVYISKNAKKANEIYNTMSVEEQFFITGGDTRSWYVKQEEYNEKIIYSSLCLDNNIPVSFLDVFFINGVGEISIGVRNNQRNKGYASKEIKKFLHWYKNNKDKFTILSWYVNINNVKSIKLAEKFGFTRDIDRDFDENWIAYKYEY